MASKLVIKFTNVFVKDLQKLPDHAPMTRSEFDNAYKDFVHNSSEIPKLPWKLKAMNKRESCDMLTDLVMNTYWHEGGTLDQISLQSWNDKTINMRKFQLKLEI